MQKIKFKKGLIIGPSGIGAVHFREFLNNGFEEIGFIGKSKSKNRSFVVNLKKFQNIKIINLKDFKNIKKFKPDVVSICSPFDKHLSHILKCKKHSKYIIVEKPFIWSKKKLIKGKNLQSSLRLLSESNNQIVINLPMVSLAKQIIQKKEVTKNIDYFKFCYFTKGKQKNENIAVDLLPHALSFLLTILKKKIINFNIINVKKLKSSWSCEIKIDNMICIFQFTQDLFRKESILKFSLNNNHYVRHQKDIDGKRINYLVKNNRKKISLNNPMNEYLCYLLKSFNNKNKIKINNNLVLKIMKIKEDLLSFKKFDI